MTSLRPDNLDVRVYQRTGRPDNKALELADQLLLILPVRPSASLWKKLPHGSKMQQLIKKRAAGAVPAMTDRLPNKRQTLLVAGTIAKDASAFEQLTLGRKLVAAACAENAGSLGIVVLGFDSATTTALYNNMLAAALAAGFALPSFKSTPTPARIKSIRLLGLDEKLDVSRTIAEAQGNNLARWLATMPPNKLDAVNYGRVAKQLAKQHGWTFKRYATRELEKLGAGAFLAVAQGNEDNSASIVHLKYRPGRKDAPADLSLVGKGIVFDTGGTNLKPFDSMLDMHGDMQGSAVAIGTFLAITKLRLPIAVDCWLALTENRIGPKAYKSQDVVTAANGKTIQTIHTDAEGRMALADTLVLASREAPKLVIDYATLTGTCVAAITTRYSGVFTNKAEWHPRLKRSGQQSGERVWPFPIGKEFLAALDSPVADLKQCSPKGSGDHILAASFLAEFIENDTPWIHIDLSASDVEGGLGHVPSKFTGFGVRYTMGLLLDENILGTK
ncbi:MAG: leucyl aminopeptidase family protein [Woeseiaceae bacterium]